MNSGGFPDVSLGPLDLPIWSERTLGEELLSERQLGEELAQRRSHLEKGPPSLSLNRWSFTVLIHSFMLAVANSAIQSLSQSLFQSFTQSNTESLMSVSNNRSYRPYRPCISSKRPPQGTPGTASNRLQPLDWVEPFSNEQIRSGPGGPGGIHILSGFLGDVAQVKGMIRELSRHCNFINL